ncbi:hypothetical protein ASE61_10780 [Bosea sp. Root670]|jgi:hypothetical protein|uniref:TonB C-terminal domain-containing protein n=1 Tax=Bosea robiniae TaxID=1036780 RepID=A0ABY0P2T6_9HYPH|nr:MULTISPECIES: hypothetical protein [Bosea]KRE04071.1 hypothetical protein ASE61_10780 [Bosea sp. Root670]SDG94673.1 hypothetical protein SAMN05421844_10678 [Bosea robiniae]
MLRTALIGIALVLGLGGALAQETRDLGLPPPSGSQNPVLPPPSGSQNPILPPQSGQRYNPGVGGPFRGDDIPGLDQRRLGSPRVLQGTGEIGLIGQVTPDAPPDGTETVDRLDEIAPAVRRCWNPPPLPGDLTGAMVSLRFSLRRDGSLFGQPRVTWETKRGDAAFQQRFSDSAVAAIRSCTPMRLSAGLGASIAGRPFTIRFHGRTRLNERQT